MKISFQSSDFKKALDAVMTACPARPAIPEHAFVHMRTTFNHDSESGIILSCQDGHMEIKRWLPCTVQEEGEAFVQAALLRDYTAVMPGEVTLQCGSKDARCILTSGRKKSTIPCANPEDYAFNDSRLQNQQLASISPDSLCRFVSTCAHCAGVDMSRLALTGMLLEFEDGLAKATCTDGFVFAHVETPSQVYEKSSLLVPVDILQKASKLLSSSETDIVISGGVTLCRMDGDCAQITFPLLSAQYIDYRRLMHFDAPTTVSVSCKELQSCVKQCAIAATTNQKGTVTVSVEDSVLSVSARADVSDAASSVECLHYGVPIQAAFNARYLIDALDRAGREADFVTLLFKGKVAPCAVIPQVSDELKPFAPYFLVLPVRTFSS